MAYRDDEHGGFNDWERDFAKELGPRTKALSSKEIGEMLVNRMAKTSPQSEFSLEKMSEMLEQLLPGSTKETVVAMTKTFYDGATERYRPLIEALPAVAGMVAKDLVPLVIAALTMGDVIAGNEEVLALANASYERVARERADKLKAYLGAGFNRREAVNLLMLDVANAKLVAEMLGNSLNKAVDKIKTRKSE